MLGVVRADDCAVRPRRAAFVLAVRELNDHHRMRERGQLVCFLGEVAGRELSDPRMSEFVSTPLRGPAVTYIGVLLLLFLFGMSWFSKLIRVNFL